MWLARWLRPKQRLLPTTSPAQLAGRREVLKTKFLVVSAMPTDVFLNVRMACQRLTTPRHRDDTHMAFVGILEFPFAAQARERAISLPVERKVELVLKFDEQGRGSISSSPRGSVGRMLAITIVRHRRAIQV